MKKNKKILWEIKSFLIVFIVLSLVFIFAYTYALYLKNQRHAAYNNAIDLFEEGYYEEAKDAFNSIGNYEDSLGYFIKSLQYIKYNEAQKLLYAGQYQEAAEKFASLGDFDDSASRATEALYANAEDLYNKGEYEEAFSFFQQLQGYENSDLYIADITLLLQEKMQERIYKEAIRLFESGEYRSVLEELSKIEGYPNSVELIQKCNDILARQRLGYTFSAGVNGSVAIKTEDEIVFSGEQMREQISPLIGKDLVSIACFGIVAAGLRQDGTVVVSDVKGIDVDNWENIIAIDVGYAFVVGLKSDGTVVSSGHNGDGQCNVENWESITAIASGWRHTVGLTTDKTVKITGYANRNHRNQVEAWTDIIAIAAGGGSGISAGGGHTVGLKEDGSVVAAGDNTYGQCNVQDWEHIVAIAAGDWHTVGLREDGSVVATGLYEDGDYIPGTSSDPCAVDVWEDIVAIDANDGYTLGLTSEGTIVATGYNAQNQRPNSGDWLNILVYDEWDTIKKNLE